MQPWTAAVVTASDGVANGTREDASGAALERLLEAEGFEVALREVVPDDRETLAKTLRRLADRTDVALVVVTGGTGFGPRDVTPEATRDVIEREAPGLAEAMRAAGRAQTPMADLSRSIAGSRGRTLIVDLPGSPKGATESLQAVLGLLPHALDLLAGDTEHTHGAPEPATPVEHEHDHSHDDDSACALAHGDVPADRHPGTLVAIYASPVARHLLHFARETGYDTVLVEPDADRIETAHRRNAGRIAPTADDLDLGDDAHVVMTDHDRADLGPQLAAALATPARYVGLMGSPRHMPPHEGPLRELGVADDDIARVQRPIGLNIGSKTPPEIAIATLAGLIAEAQGRPGGHYDA
jgi:molybdenum cofactor synthesis domain-containing protein